MKSLIITSGRLLTGFMIAMVLSLLLIETGNAQQTAQLDKTKTYQVTLKDGSVITGKIISDTDQEIVIQSVTMGEITLQKENIKSVLPIASINEKKSGIWFANPNPSKYLLGNSAIPMEKHTGYFQNTWVFVNTFSYAFTKNISLAAGFEIISLLAEGGGPYAFYINPKVSFKLAENFYAGGNILYANTIKTAENFGGLATLNGFATYGNKNNNLTGGIGFGWADGKFSPKPVIILSGMVRASKRIGFVSENWIVPTLDEGTEDSYSYYGIFSYGIRFLGEKISVDLAFLNNPDIASELIIGIPWLDFVVNF